MPSHVQTISESEEAALAVNGMNCASCVSHVQKAAQKLAGVESVDVNLARGRAVVRFDPKQTDPQKVAAAITESGYPTAPEHPAHSGAEAEEARHHHQSEEAGAWFRRAVVGIVLWFPVEAVHWLTTLFSKHDIHYNMRPNWMIWTALITSTISIAYVGAGFYRSAFKALKRFTSNMDTLIALGASVAYGYSLVALVGYLLGWWRMLPQLYFMEAAGLLALISLGHWLEAHARQSAGSAIRELLQLAPPTALRLLSPLPLGEGQGEGAPSKRSLSILESPLTPTLSQGEREYEEVPIAELHVGDRILIRPGDRIPIDGTVIKGPSTVEESMITGEPLPVTRDMGDPVIGGTQNIDGRLIVRVTKTGSETALAQIIKLVEHAQASKPAIQRLADQVAAVFVPSVLAIALITGIGWYVFGDADPAKKWGQIALAVCSVLIIACPCALGLAIPAALMVGTGRGARKGILIRDIDALQKAEKIDTVVLDKTGTITKGKPVVARIQPLNGLAEDEILRLAASAERFSEHPIAKAIVSAASDRRLRLSEPSLFNNEPGYGIIAEIEGKTLLIGSEAMLQTRVTGFQPAAQNHTLEARGTSVHIAVQRDGTIERLGTIEIADEIKPDSLQAIQQLHQLNLRTVLLSGDNRAAAEAVAKNVGIDDVRAEVKPDGKAQVIRELQNQNSKVAMIGDGINDAPALAQADLGIAIGSGSDIAKEAGDIVLVGGSLHGISTALRLSRATMRTIRQNLFFAFLYNVLAIPLAAFGLLNPYIAAAAMALSDVTVLGNALLLRRAKID